MGFGKSAGNEEWFILRTILEVLDRLAGDLIVGLIPFGLRCLPAIRPTSHTRPSENGEVDLRRDV